MGIHDLFLTLSMSSMDGLTQFTVEGENRFEETPVSLHARRCHRENQLKRAETE